MLQPNKRFSFGPDFLSITISLAIFAAASAAIVVPAAAVEVNIVYPREGARIGPVKNSFVFGSVKPATATLAINGSTVAVYRTGSFLAFVPFETGEFKIKAEATFGEDKVEQVRSVTVQPPDIALPSDPLKIAAETIEPSQAVALRPGDLLTVRFRGSPEAKGQFRFRGKDGAPRSDWKPMLERGNPVEGTYEGTTRVPADVNGCFIEVRLTNVKEKSAEAVSAQPVRVAPNPFQLAETKSDETILRTGPSIGSELMGYDLFLPKGTMLEVTGRSGIESRLKVADGVEGWTEEKNLDLKDHRTLPRVMIDSVKIKEKERSTLVTVETKRSLPYRAAVSNDFETLRLTLYQAGSNIDRVRHDQPDANRGLRHFRWQQRSVDALELELPMKRKIWGYDVRYDAGKLTCEIFDGPPAPKGGKLKGIMIAVDPGHSPEPTDGTVGGLGVKENEVAYQIGMKLKEVLEHAGAQVYVTKLSSENMTLPERGKRAVENGADLMVSIHANALPDGINPWERSGFSVFYFQPQSLDLARAVHESYAKNIKTQDDGFYYANLAVCRITQMPSILTESGYLIRPDEEEMLLDPAFQARAAKTIAEGVTNFLKQWHQK